MQAGTACCCVWELPSPSSRGLPPLHQVSQDRGRERKGIGGGVAGAGAHLPRRFTRQQQQQQQQQPPTSNMQASVHVAPL
ncbi:MAG: hypothetical protein WDW38_006017 [Sanguina aurantia]